MRDTGADRPVLAMMPGNAGGAKGAGRPGSSTGQSSMRRDEPVGVPKPKEKPFVISKWVVKNAYEKVKANAGAAGVDGESIAAFEADLKANLYKVWNRMSSGTYFPPPVRAVEIPKKAGGVRILGVTTVADRVAQTVVRMYLEPGVEPLFHPDSYGYRAWALGSGCGGYVPETVLEIRLDDRFGSPGVLRLDRSRPHAQSGVEAHGPALGPPLREAVAESAAAARGRQSGRKGPWHPAGARDLSVVG